MLLTRAGNGMLAPDRTPAVWRTSTLGALGDLGPVLELPFPRSVPPKPLGVLVHL